MKAQQLHAAQSAPVSASVSHRRANAELQAGLMRSLRTASVLAGQALGLLALLASPVCPGATRVLLRPELLSRVLQFANQFVSKVANASKRATLPLASSDAQAQANIGLIFPADEWLRAFCDLYLALQPHELFLDLMAREESGFVAADFASAVTLLQRGTNNGNGNSTSSGISSDVGPEWTARFESLLSLVSSAHAVALQSRQCASGADVPEDFLDPITCTLMDDPVRLPGSGVTMDRAVLTRHLLNDQTDPFNRAPLDINQLAPDAQLRERIRQWRAQQQAESQQSAAGAASEQAAGGAGCKQFQ